MAMIFLVDESVNRSVAEVLRKDGYEVLLSVEVLGPGASDANIARIAHERHAIAVDNNAKHFQALIARRKDEKSRHRFAGRLSLRCDPAIAPARIKELLPLIRMDWDYRQTCRDTRVIIDVYDDRITLFR
jgi:hypothetical protein